MQEINERVWPGPSTYIDIAGDNFKDEFDKC